MFQLIKKNKFIIILVSIFILGASLRLFYFEDLVRFNDDQARDAQLVNRMIEKNDFPLLGPKAGGTKFNLGPAFYYMEYLSALIFGNNPAGIATFIVILSILSIPLFYYFFRFFFQRNICLILTFLYAISFYAIKYSKFAWNPNVIPFFFLLFFILLFKIIEERSEKISLKIILFAVLTGIIIQLHTLLLAMIPVLLFSLFLFFWFKEKKPRLKIFLFIVFISLLLNSSLFIHDIKNNYENLKLFLAGTEKKTEQYSLSRKFLMNGQFFVAGNAYVLSGFESQKDWSQIKKFIVPENKKEIVVAMAGTLFLIIGLFFLFIEFKKEKMLNKKIFWGIVLFSFILFFFIFWPLASGLKSRFYIVCFLFPFLFLGLILKQFALIIKNKTIFYIFVFSALAFAVFANKIPFQKAYDFSNYAHKDDIYGGMSLKESKEISNYIVSSSQNDNLKDKKIRLGNFKFNKSINYLNKMSGLDSTIESSSSMKKMPENSVFVWMGKSKNKEKIIEKNIQMYDFVDSENFGRFSVFLFQTKK